MEAMLKVIVIMTERYDKILKRGTADRQKLLFRSLAVFDRGVRVSDEQPRMERRQPAEDEKAVPLAASAATSFSVDRPGSDDDEDEDEDDDELALAALESLDAIEVFRHDQRTDTKIHHARIPSESFRSKSSSCEKSPD